MQGWAEQQVKALSSAPAELQKLRAKVSFDVEEVLEVLKEELQSPVVIGYRESLSGKRDIEQLTKHKNLIRRTPPMKPKELTQLLECVAAAKEDEWHLCGEASGWAKQTSKRLRAMKRDISQALVKTTSDPKRPGPGWLQDFMDCPVEMVDDSVEVLGDSDEVVGDNVQTHQREASTCGSAGRTDSDTLEPQGRKRYRFGWDSDLQVVIFWG